MALSEQCSAGWRDSTWKVYSEFVIGRKARNIDNNSCHVVIEWLTRPPKCLIKNDRPRLRCFQAQRKLHSSQRLEKWIRRSPYWPDPSLLGIRSLLPNYRYRTVDLNKRAQIYLQKVEPELAKRTNRWKNRRIIWGHLLWLWIFLLLHLHVLKRMLSHNIWGSYRSRSWFYHDILRVLRPAREGT